MPIDVYHINLPQLVTLQWCHTSVIASQIGGNLTVCSTACSCEYQRERHKSAQLALGNGNPPFLDSLAKHDDVIKWKHFPRYWPFVRGIHRSPENSPHIGQWRGALMFTLICARINGWVNNREAGDLRRHRAHYDVIVMRPVMHKAFPRHGVFMQTITDQVRAHIHKSLHFIAVLVI